MFPSGKHPGPSRPKTQKAKAETFGGDGWVQGCAAAAPSVVAQKPKDEVPRNAITRAPSSGPVPSRFTHILPLGTDMFRPLSTTLLPS